MGGADQRLLRRASFFGRTLLPASVPYGDPGGLGGRPRMTVGEIEVWRIRLDEARVPPPTAGEAARAARFVSPILGARYLCAHGSLRAVLAQVTQADL